MVNTHSFTTTNRVSGTGSSNEQRAGSVFKYGYSVMLWLLLSVISTPAWADSFTASVDRRQLAEQETFQLTLTYSPQILLGSPDLSVIQDDFDILSGPRRMNSYQSVNGQSESKTEWTYLLMPKQQGESVVPGFEFKGESTDPIVITVEAVSQAVQQKQDKDVFFDIQISQQDNYYVQGQILYTEKLYYRVNHQDANLTQLEVEDARIEALQDTKRYVTVINGERVGVYERRFAIFPEKSGTLVIPGQRFQALAVSSGFSQWSNRTSSLSAVSRPIEVDVLPIPDQYPVAPWLPAQKLTLDDVYSDDTDHWTVGTPITRTLRIQTNGLPASQVVLPDTHLPAHLKRYPDQAQYDDHKTDTGIQGVFTQPVAFVPTEAGELVLPELRIPWWNTLTNQLEYATVPEQRLTIYPTPGASNSSLPQNHSNNTGSGTDTSHNDSGNDVSGAARSSHHGESHTGSGPWMLIAALLLVSNFVTGFLLWRQSTRTPNQDADTHQQLSENHAWRVLRKACQSGDASAVRQALIQWTNDLQPSEAISTLHGVQRLMSQVLPDADGHILSVQLEQLDKSLFDGNDQTRFSTTHSTDLFEFLKAQRSALLTHYQKGKDSQQSLPPLHGNTQYQPTR